MKTKPYRRRSPTATAANQGSGTRKPIRQARRTASATSTEDPFHRAIEEHRKAGQERYEIGRKPGRTDHDLDDAIANELDALRRLFDTAPATHDGMVALFRHCQTRLPGDYTTVIDEFVEMCVNGDEDKWSPTRWARMMELALRRIGPRSNQSAKPALSLFEREMEIARAVKDDARLRQIGDRLDVMWEHCEAAITQARLIADQRICHGQN